MNCLKMVRQFISIENTFDVSEVLNVDIKTFVGKREEGKRWPSTSQWSVGRQVKKVQQQQKTLKMFNNNNIVR